MTMSTDIEEVTEEQIDAALEDAPPEGVEVETPADDEPNPATDLEGAVLQEQQEAALEYGSEETEETEERTNKQLMEDAEREAQVEEVMVEVCESQQRAEEKWVVAHRLAQESKDAKKSAEAADDDYRDAGRRLRKLREGRFPDGDKYPMFDKAKAEINASFPKPDSIPPLPPDSFAEALRRKQRDTKVASMGLNDSTTKALEALGLNTAFDIVRKFNELGEKGREPGSLKGITANRLAGIGTALEKITDECQAEWDAAHPAEDEPLPPLVIAPRADYLVVCNSCDYTRLKSVTIPCPNGHVSGFAMALGAIRATRTGKTTTRRDGRRTGHVRPREGPHHNQDRRSRCR
jgi:hypothetical protein